MCDLKQASPPKNCPTCGVVLESSAACRQCSKGEEKAADGDANVDKRPVKPYADLSAPNENDLCKMLSQAFSEKDPCERPWCGRSIEVGLLVVSPTNITLVDIREANGVNQAVVHVPQNWREAWYVETSGGVRHELADNPCDKAERAISNLRNSLRSFRNTDDRRSWPPVKYLIIYPDNYRFEGLMEFFMVEREELLTLQLKNMCDIAATILAPAQRQRLDSRKCRAWIEGTILKKSDDSIIGTWLDPSFDKVDSAAETERSWIRRFPKKAPSEQQESSSTESSRRAPIHEKLDFFKSKLIGMVITALLVGIVGWRFSDAIKSETSDSYMPPSIPKNSENAVEAAGIAMPQKISREIDHHSTLAAAETRASKDSDLKVRKIKRQIEEAIRRRAISGVTVYFVRDTAHLKGRVATDSQKAAAEKAARRVQGVKNVRSSIEVDSPSRDG
jgi:hypothetical protein